MITFEISPVVLCSMAVSQGMTNSVMLKNPKLLTLGKISAT